MALVVTPAGIAVTRWFQLRSHTPPSRTSERISAVTAQLAESVAGMAVVQAFNRERAFQNEFEGFNEANRRSNVHAQKLSSVFFPAIEFLGTVRRSRCLRRVALLIDGRHPPDRDADRRGGLLQLVFQPLQELSSYTHRCSRPQPRWRRSARSSMPSKTSPTARTQTDGRIEGRLELDGVTFAYGQEPVVHALSIEVAAGGCIAMVGESGGGKSTTAKLIARFYDPDRARPVDGVDLRDVQLRSYRRQLGVVLQDPFLFSGTIADNIRFAKPDATTTR